MGLQSNINWQTKVQNCIMDLFKSMFIRKVGGAQFNVKRWQRTLYMHFVKEKLLENNEF